MNIRFNFLSVILRCTVFIWIVLRHELLLVLLIILVVLGVVCVHLIWVILATISIAIVGWVVVYSHLVGETSVLSDWGRICHVLGCEVISAEVWTATKVSSSGTSHVIASVTSCSLVLRVCTSLSRIGSRCQVKSIHWTICEGRRRKCSNFI